MCRLLRQYGVVQVTALPLGIIAAAGIPFMQPGILPSVWFAYVSYMHAPLKRLLLACRTHTNSSLKIE